MSVNLYDDEAITVWWVVQQVQSKWADKPDTLANLKEFQKELEGRLYDAGFIARVEVATVPASVVIEGRVKEEEFDHERYAHDVIKSRAEGGI